MVSLHRAHFFRVVIVGASVVLAFTAHAYVLANHTIVANVVFIVTIFGTLGWALVAFTRTSSRSASECRGWRSVDVVEWDLCAADMASWVGHKWDFGYVDKHVEDLSSSHRNDFKQVLRMLLVACCLGSSRDATGDWDRRGMRHKYPGLCSASSTSLGSLLVIAPTLTNITEDWAKPVANTRNTFHHTIAVAISFDVLEWLYRANKVVKVLLDERETQDVAATSSASCRNLPLLPNLGTIYDHLTAKRFSIKAINIQVQYLQITTYLSGHGMLMVGYNDAL
ncbi:hypothetical protein H257_04148 [Aphanomyces astaci]|uniref:Uncharacterized protein n=1 Tax=Aphanomyces astaci TaxID=112090 RepID=W4GWL0_APHAT|nr:hypothetical protein H257_04148 [Aphanomyces astaci]ETV83419.1 hypothetical protein H257_04148 [Aphanomyces astaci]|eukprot:XP_009826849.1 hypothetical protein H257_04148 [Aphanomyces astaci]